MKTSIKLLFIGILLLFVCCKSNNKQTDNLTQINRFIKPPFQGVDVPLQEYEFLAEEGNTIYYKSGSIILLPPNSLVDKDGNIVKGKVKITYREFADPVDFFVSGIPMAYDSGGTKYTFESSAMCEIHAYKDSVPLYVNPKIKPEINLASLNNNQTHNLYYLDTASRRWIYKGKDIVSNISPLPDKAAKKETSNKKSITVVPVKPEKASGKRPIFSIKIDPYSVPELKAYNNLKFEVDESEKTYNPNVDTKVEWGDVEILKGKKAGTYLVTFSNDDRKISILARPVFEGKDYDEAIKVYEKKEIEYKQLLAERLAIENKQKENNAKTENANKLKADKNKEIAAKNKVTEAKNKEIELKNKEIDLKNIEISKENERVAKLRILIAERNKIREQEFINKMERINKTKEDQQKANEEFQKQQKERELNAYKAGGTQMNNEIIRTFAIDGFGVFNCDIPLKEQGIPILAKYKTNKGEDVLIKNLAVVYKKFNGVWYFNDNNIKIVPGSDNMLWGVSDNKFIYMTYEEFNKCNIDNTTKEYTFTMNITDKITSSDDIRKILGIKKTSNLN